MWVQLRSPKLNSRELLSLGKRLREATRAVGARLLINDRLDLALLLDADGVHLGPHSVGQAEARRLLGNDALITTTTCHHVEAIGDSGLGTLTRCCSLPSSRALARTLPWGQVPSASPAKSSLPASPCRRWEDSIPVERLEAGAD
ncbi:thiamine phosphate synthase [Endomicrobium sp. AH-315-J14]|nr:thiamine phosphate synthase [Endomicrobium sp. AH-315-J14]